MKKSFFHNMGCAHTHPYVIALFSELPLTKKKRGTNEYVEGQAWSFGVIRLCLDLYKK
jgi:hypothetical protein